MMTTQIFTLYPSHEGFIPGSSTLEFGTVGLTCLETIGVMIVGVVMGLVSIGSLISFYTGVVMPTIFATQAVDTMGQVIACEMVRNKSYGSVPELTYTYTWDGRLFQDTVEVHQRNLSCPPNMDQMAMVKVLPSDPHQSHLVLLTDDQSAGAVVKTLIHGVFSLGFGLLMGFVALMTALSPYTYLRARRAYPRLMSEGQLLRGEIVKISGASSGKGRHFLVSVSYQFQSPLGETLKGNARLHRDDLRDSGLPPVGMLVNILHVDDKTHVML